jgi:hypothetical protein
MKHRFSLFALLLLASLVLGAQSAAAKKLQKLDYGSTDVIVGHTSYGQVTETVPDHVTVDQPLPVLSIKLRNLFTGRSTLLPVPADYFENADDAVAGYGYWADVYGNDFKIFVTGPNGVRMLPAATPAAPDACPSRRSPMLVTRTGDVAVLEAVYLPRANPADTSCPIDTAKSNLTLFKADGSTEQLWLPSEYAPWLAQEGDGSNFNPLAEMQGNQLLLYSRSTATSPALENSFVVLDVKKRKVVRKVTGLKSTLDNAKFSGSTGVLATHWGGNGTSTVTRYPLPGGKARLLHKGTLKNFYPMACGTRTLLLPKFGHYKIVGRKGRTLKRVQIRRIEPICSSEVAYFGPGVRLYLPSLGR